MDDTMTSACNIYSTCTHQVHKVLPKCQHRFPSPWWEPTEYHTQIYSVQIFVFLHKYCCFLVSSNQPCTGGVYIFGLCVNLFKLVALCANRNVYWEIFGENARGGERTMVCRRQNSQSSKSPFTTTTCVSIAIECPSSIYGMDVDST